LTLRAIINLKAGLSGVLSMFSRLLGALFWCLPAVVWRTFGASLEYVLMPLFVVAL
jgi:hypothetical protein